MNATQHTQRPNTRRRARMPLRVYLVALVLAASVPAFAVAAFAVWQAAASYRDASLVRLTDTTRTLARAVEGELDNSATLLRTLAAAPMISNSDVQGLQQWLDQSGMAPDAKLASEVLADVPPGPWTPAGVPRAVAEQAQSTGQPALSNLYEQGLWPTPRVAMAISHTEAGSAARVLALLIPPRQLVRAVQPASGAPGSILVAVTDGTGHIVARSRDAERFVGKPVPDWSKLVAMGTEQGSFEARTTEGRQVVLAFQRLRNTPGWVVVVGEPLESFNASWVQPLQRIALWGGLAVVVAVLLAAWLAGQVLKPVQALARNAEQVVADDAGPPRSYEPAASAPLPILELESLRESIEASEAALRRRAETERRSAAALAASELRYRTLAHAGALVLWRSTPTGALTMATGWSTLTGRAEEQALGFGWLECAHPDDVALVRTAWAGSATADGRFDAEFRFRTGEGTWRWVRGRGAPVPQIDGQETQEWIGVIEDVDERRRAQARIVYMAHHDALTGLPNRVQLRERLEAALQRARRGEHSALLYLDLDRFKEVNDTLGHPVGDALLQAVTTRLKALVRGTDTVARLGGDEFVVLQSQITDAADLAARIVDALSTDFELNGQRVSIGASVGIALTTEPGSNADALLKHADLALYRAKQEGRGRHSFFEPEMDARMQARRRAELQLRHACANGELRLSYQPLVNVHSRSLCGLEARVEWWHSERGLLAAPDFVPLAGELGLMPRIGGWMLQQACADVVRWPDVPKVAVPVSPAQLKHPALYETVMRVLQATGLAAKRLELEIHERALLDDPEGTLATLGRLKSAGVRIVMDDFGSGHSALGSLRSFAFDKVKIEQSFVREIGRRSEGDAVVRAVTGLCGTLGILTGARGVDSESQFELLSAETCTEVQGRLFGDFHPAARIPELCRLLSGGQSRGTSA